MEIKMSGDVDGRDCKIMACKMSQYDSIYYPEKNFPIDKDEICSDCGEKNCVQIIGPGSYYCTKCGSQYDEV